MKHRHRLFGALLGLTLMPLSSAHAESSRYLEVEGFARLLDGYPETTSLSEDGAIGLSFTARERLTRADLSLGATTLWNNDVIAVHTQEHSEVIAIDPKGATRVVIDDLKGDVVTLMGTHHTSLVLAVAPKPRLIFIDMNAKRSEVTVPDVGFVWDAVSLPDQSLIVATGEPGRVMRRDGKGAWTTLFEADEAHIKTLAYDAKLGLFAGGGERGIVYHGTLAGKFRAIYDSGSTEITALAINEDAVFAATAQGAQAALHDDSAEAGAGGKTPEVRSSVVRVDLHGAAELLAGSTDEIVFDLISESPGNLLLATGAVGRKEAHGRLYRLNMARKGISLLHQSSAKRLVRLLRHPAGLLVAVGQGSSTLTEFTATQASTGTYLTPALDTGVTSQFGVAQAQGEWPKGSRGTLSVRTGQTAEPDASWSAWSRPTDASLAERVQVPEGRFAQMRLTLSGTPAAQPQVVRLRLAYLRQNLAPFVRDLAVLDKGLALSALPPPEEPRSKMVALTDRTPEESNDGPRKNVVRVRQTQQPGALTVRWLADDANGDELDYTLWMRAVTEPNWRLLATDMTDPFHTFDSTQLADGYYVFRVRVSDHRSNPLAQAKNNERQSRLVLVDNTPPVFRKLHVKTHKGRATLTGEVADAASLLTGLRVAIDGGPLRPIAPADGVLDGPAEKLEVDLGPLLGGAHGITVVATDEAQNSAYESISFTMPLGGDR